MLFQDLDLGDRTLSVYRSGDTCLFPGKDVNFVFRMEKLGARWAFGFFSARLARVRLKSQVTFTSVGAHELKGFEGKHELFSCES
jgi:hypothetical protein